MDQAKLKKWIEELIKHAELWRFYKSREWMDLRDKILEENHNECECCKEKGIIKRYDVDEQGQKHLIRTVHHVQFVRRHPELALSRYYIHAGIRYKNLIVVCKACHNELHPEKRKTKSNHFCNEELW